MIGFIVPPRRQGLAGAERFGYTGGAGSRRLRKMKRINWKAWCLGAVSLVFAGWAFGLFYEGFIADHYMGVFTYPFVDKPAAERAYKRLPPNAPIAVQEVAARRLIQADPTNPNSWNAVSYVEYEKAGGMSAKALEALDHSYAVSFFDPDSAVWRVSYALENWPAIPVALRRDVITEAQVTLKDPALNARMKTRLQAVQNPQGRLAALLLLGS